MGKALKLFFIIIIISFCIMFFSSSGGYYEYELNKKTNLTEEAISRFEQDVKEGKEIDVNDYLVVDNKDYSNKVSDAGVTISNKIGKIFSGGLKLIFNSIGKFIED